MTPTSARGGGRGKAGAFAIREPSVRLSPTLAGLDTTVIGLSLAATVALLADVMAETPG